MSADDPCVVLVTSGLLSKWGFSDGDEPDHLLDYCDESSLPYPEWCSLLPRLVREFVLPVLDQKVEVIDVETNHNPIRAVTVDGVNVEDHWYDTEYRLPLTPETVEVPFSVIFAMAAR